MNDPQIRDLLCRTFLKKYKENRQALILEEVGVLNGSAIVDLAVFSKIFNQAFEIKSSEDSLTRLPQQLHYYQQVFDYITVVTQPSHLDELKVFCPKFVGILLVYNDGDLNYVQKPTANPLINKKKLIKLLWRDEVYKFLKEKKDIKGLSTQTNAAIKKIACETLTLSEVRELVFETLKSRKLWKNEFPII